MKTSIVVGMVIYMLIVYTTFGVFAFGNIKFFDSGPSEDTLFSVEQSNSEIEDDAAAYKDISWIESIAGFFGTIIDAFSYMFGLLTFNAFGSLKTHETLLPSYLLWIPMIMVLPCWLYITFELGKWAVKILQGLGNWVPFT